MNNNTKEVLTTLIWVLGITTVLVTFLLTMAWIGSPTSFEFKISMDNNSRDVFYSALNYSSNDFNNPTLEFCEMCCETGYLSVQCGFCDCKEVKA